MGRSKLLCRSGDGLRLILTDGESCSDTAGKAERERALDREGEGTGDQVSLLTGGESSENRSRAEGAGATFADSFLEKAGCRGAGVAGVS